MDFENKNIESNNQEDLKIKQANLQKTNEQLDKSIEASEHNQLGTIIFTHLKMEDKQNINMVLNLLAKLVDNNVSDVEKDSVFYTLAGNSDLLGLFSNKKFISDYIIFLYTSLKMDKDFENNLRAAGYDTLIRLVSKRSVEDVVNIILNTILTCSSTDLEIPNTLEEVNQAVKKLKSFSLNKQNVKVKRPDSQQIEYKAVFKDDRTDEEREADRQIAEMASIERRKEITELGGEENYNKKLRALAKESKIINVIEIRDSDIDEVVDCHEMMDYEEVRPNISDVLNDIIDIYKAAFDLSITMRKFVGVYIFDDDKNRAGSNQAELKVMEVVETDNKGVVKLMTKEHNSKVLEWIQHNYDYPVKDSLKVARHNQVPSLENIVINGYNYYPTFIARYALGFVKKEKYTNFDKFIKAVKADVEDRLYKIYKSEIKMDGKIIRGRDLFRAHNVDRLKLIGAFTNAVIFITGKGSENFNNTQFRCICAYSHTKTIDYYTGYKNYEDGSYRGLSEAAQAHFIRANGAFSTNILDITYLSDKAKFYKEVSWAYKELGVVYGEGDIPDVLDDRDGEGVVIGKTLAGELVKFNLGSNAKFVTSIYAGSRSGKGVTTLSILAAIMASGIGICYLDCKPDMANCFWDIEARAAKRGRIGDTDHVYSYDVNADKSRYNKYSPMKSLMKQRPELRNSNMASALFILKNIQLITLTGQYKQRIGDASTMVWIIDEVNNMINKLNSGFSEFERIAPKENAKDLTDTQQYVKNVMTFWRNLQVTAASGVNDIYGQCGYKYVVIGQNPGDMFTGSKPSGKLTCGADILRILGTAPENVYIYGRGLKGVQAVGSKAFHRDRSSEEINALEANKYFVMRKTAQQNANDGSQDDILFQPFLTLNYDNVLASCWTGGLGQAYGYKPHIKEGDVRYPEMIKNYKTNLNAALGQPTRADVLESTDSGYGVVDEGTGFFGLVKTYYSKYGAEAENMAFDVALKPYKEITDILTNMQLIGENSLFGYRCVEDFLYDFSPEAMQFTNYAELEVLLEDRMNNTEDVYDEEDEDSNFNFNINYSKENDDIEEENQLETSGVDNTEIDNDAEMQNLEGDFEEKSDNEHEVDEDNEKYDTPEAPAEDFIDGSDKISVEENKMAYKGSQKVRSEIDGKPAKITIGEKEADVDALLNELEKRQSGYYDDENDRPAIKITVGEKKSENIRKKANVDSTVKLFRSGEDYSTKIADDGRLTTKKCVYENVYKEALPALDDELRIYSPIPFVDRLLVQRNIQKRYKNFIKAINDTIGWTSVEYLEMSETEFIINKTASMRVCEYGPSGYDVYDTMDFEDMLMKRAIRLKHLYVSGAIAERITEDCGTDIFNKMFDKHLTLQSIELEGYEVITRANRKIALQMALYSKAKDKDKAKDALLEAMFASGMVKKNPQNIATAQRLIKKAKKSNRKFKSKGLKAIYEIGQMTPMEAIGSAVASVVYGFKKMINNVAQA